VIRAAPDASAVSVGIVGAGFIGGVHAAAWRSLGVRRLVIEDPHESCARRVAGPVGAETATDLEELVRSVDIVDICTPTNLHRAGVEAAARGGRPVICEKPIARTIVDAEAMVAACARAKVPLFIAHVVRYFNEYAAAKDAIDAGRIGRPAVLRLRRESFRPMRGQGHWLLDEAKSGGLILDLMIHDLDYARYVAGEVETVMARQARGNGGAGVEFAVAILRHSAGALTHVTAAWSYPPPVFRTGFELAGDGGLIEFESVDQRPITRYLLAEAEGVGPAVGIPTSPVDEDPYAAELADFLAAITTGRATRVAAADGVAALRIALAARESSRLGRPVAVAETSGIANR
jgi:predicted dehydrogenase